METTKLTDIEGNIPKVGDVIAYNDPYWRLKLTLGIIVKFTKGSGIPQVVNKYDHSINFPDNCSSIRSKSFMITGIGPETLN